MSLPVFSATNAKGLVEESLDGPKRLWTQGFRTEI